MRNNITSKPLELTLHTSRKPLQHLLATGVPSCEEPGSVHEQTCKISREELPHPNKQRQDEMKKRNFFFSLPLRCRLLILVDSCAEWGWPYTLETIQGHMRLHWQGKIQKNTKQEFIFIYKYCEKGIQDESDVTILCYMN